MFYQYQKINVYYEYNNRNHNKTLIYLHGWGRSSDDFQIKGDYNILLIDFPGFGRSDEMLKAFQLMDYVECLDSLIKELEIKSPILIGHSFGGRVAILYSYLYPVKKMILVNSAGIKPKRNITYYYKIYSYKLKKSLYKLLIKLSDEFMEEYQALKKIGSNDYVNLSDVMRKTYSNIVNLDLKKYMKKIKCETHIFGGVKDQTVLYKNTEEIHKLIKNSKLYPFLTSGHFLFFDEKEKYQNLINKVVGDDFEVDG